MVEMYEIFEGTFVPKECCTFGEVVVDDDMLPCGKRCDKVCEECVIQEVFNSYAKLSGQAEGAEGQRASRAADGKGMTVRVRMKGHKKIRKEVSLMVREVSLLNKEMREAVKLAKALRNGRFGLRLGVPNGFINNGAGKGSGDGEDKEKLR